jgi:hypothetical protein
MKRITLEGLSFLVISLLVISGLLHIGQHPLGTMGGDVLESRIVAQVPVPRPPHGITKPRPPAAPPQGPPAPKAQIPTQAPPPPDPPALPDPRFPGTGLTPQQPW